MTLVFLSCGSANLLSASFVLSWAQSCRCLQAGVQGLSPCGLSSRVSLWDGRLRTVFQKGKGGGLRPSCGLGFGIHTASIWPHSATQNKSQGPPRFKRKARPDSRGGNTLLICVGGMEVTLQRHSHCRFVPI